MIKLINGDAYEETKKIPEKSIDLIIIDPPYNISKDGGGGAFGSQRRSYHKEIEQMKEGITNDILDTLCKLQPNIYIYIWCNKNQLSPYLNYFESKGCFIDVLVWCKTNPVPTCNNKYLSDIEYCILAREKGTKIGGTYETKHKWYVSSTNKEDKKKYKHPTIKPLNIIKNLILNSSNEGDTILDCFMGSGTTGVACKELNRSFIGIEINKKYFEIAKERIENQTLFDMKVEFESSIRKALKEG